MAVNDVQKAVKDGAILPAAAFQCVDCGDAATDYDHRDYNKPLDVEPVCRACNLRRGPAIPRKGFFSHMFAVGYAHYRSRRSMSGILKCIGIEADLSGLPHHSIEIEHWLPFKEALLAWEQS